MDNYSVLGRIYVERKPKHCLQCPLCLEGNCAGANGRMIPGVAIEEWFIKDGDAPPDWCPITEVIVEEREE